MSFSQKIQNMAAFIEFLAGSGLAIFFHLVLHNELAAYLIFGIGILLSLATYLLRDDLEKTRAELTDLYHRTHELPCAISRITDPECQIKAQEVLINTMRTVTMLQEGLIPLDETEYYLEAAKCCDATMQHIHAVDPVTSGWLSRATLVNFYHSNQRALERGVSIARIFVIHRQGLIDLDFRKIIMSQLKGGVDVRVAFRDEFPSTHTISGRDTTTVPWDFAVYDRQIATEVLPQASKYYGYKTSQLVEVEKYLHYYQLIEHNAHAVLMDGEQLILDTEASISVP